MSPSVISFELTQVLSWKCRIWTDPNGLRTGHSRVLLLPSTWAMNPHPFPRALRVEKNWVVVWDQKPATRAPNRTRGTRRGRSRQTTACVRASTLTVGGLSAPNLTACRTTRAYRARRKGCESLSSSLASRFQPCNARGCIVSLYCTPSSVNTKQPPPATGGGGGLTVSPKAAMTALCMHNPVEVAAAVRHWPVAVLASAPA